MKNFFKKIFNIFMSSFLSVQTIGIIGYLSVLILKVFKLQPLDFRYLPEVAIGGAFMLLFTLMFFIYYYVISNYIIKTNINPKLKMSVKRKVFWFIIILLCLPLAKEVIHLYFN